MRGSGTSVVSFADDFLAAAAKLTPEERVDLAARLAELVDADRPDGCPGAGVCHGPMKWCDRCGDVGRVCDDWTKQCDSHFGRDRWCDGCGEQHPYDEPCDVDGQAAPAQGGPKEAGDAR